MKTLPLCAAALLLPLLPLPAQTPPAPAAAPDAAPAAPPARRSLLKYTAPKTGGGGARVDGDGGSRGSADKVKLPPIFCLVPGHTALTTHESPSLFWFQDGGAETRFELTLIEPKNPKPLLSVASEKGFKAGVHRVSLASRKVVLQPA